MPRRAIHAPRQEGSVFPAAPTRATVISAPTTSATGAITAASPLATYTSYSTTTFVSSSTTYTQRQGVLSIVSDSAQLSSLSADGVFNTQASVSTTDRATGSATGSAAAATSSAATTHKSSSPNISTLIPAIVAPVAVLLLASFIAFFFFMRRRHHRALEAEARFEKAKPHPSPPSPADNSSSRNLLPAGAAYGQSADEKPIRGANVHMRSLPDTYAPGPPRPRRPDESNDIPPSAIGIARSTSSASAVYMNSGPRPPRSAHEMRGLPSNPRPTHRVPRSQVLSSGDIIDSYAEMRPSTAPSGSGKDYSSRSEIMRTPLPIKPLGRPPPKTSNPPYPSHVTTDSLSSRTDPFSVWSAAAPQPRHNPADSRAPVSNRESDYGLAEENLHIARLVSAVRQTPDNASISDIDERDHARSLSDDGSDVSELNDDQERMASALSSPMGTGRGAPSRSGPGGYVR